VLASSVLQLISAALFALSIPGLSLRFALVARGWGRLGVILLAVGACGDAADAIYHQLAYEMVRPGVNQAAMLPVMQRMQTADLMMYLLPLIAAFLVGCVVLAIAAAQLGIVSKWNPMLYVLFVIVAVGANKLRSGLGVPVSGRAIGLTCLGLLSFSLAWLGLALRRPVVLGSSASEKSTSLGTCIEHFADSTGRA
jgi:hypothetical protein